MSDSIWSMSGEIETMQRGHLLHQMKPPRLQLLNADAMSRYLLQEQLYPHQKSDSTFPLLWKDMPRPQLIITDETFSPDYININFVFASARLRDALALSDDAIEYLDVDTAGSHPAVLAQDYKLMNVLKYADPLDKQVTDGAWQEVELPDGSCRTVWRLPLASPHSMAPRIGWRSDFTPPAPLFILPTIGWTLATDALAESVLRAGITGIAFYDHSNDGTRSHHLKIKSLVAPL